MNHGTTHGYNSGCRCDECKAAKSVVMRDYYERNKEAVKEKARIHYENNRDAYIQSRTEYYQEHRETEDERKNQWRRANPWKSHNLTNTQYFELLDQQDGKCAGCGITLREYYEQRGEPLLFQVDHDHGHCDYCSKYSGKSCGESVRGLLCASCNINDVLA